MDSREGLIALRKRVAKLTGPDREVDGEVLALLGGAEWERAQMRASMPSGAPHDVILREGRRYAAPYTASVDAVLTLIGKVLPGWRVELLQGCSENCTWWDAFLCKPPEFEIAAETEQGMPTPALALLHALLSALPPGDTSNG